MKSKDCDGSVDSSGRGKVKAKVFDGALKKAPSSYDSKAVAKYGMSPLD